MGFADVVRAFLGVCSPFLAVFLLFLAIHHFRNRTPLRLPGGLQGRRKGGHRNWRGGGGPDGAGNPGCAGRGGGQVQPRHHVQGFVRPACVGEAREVMATGQLLGLVRHPNLVPLRALYVGSRCVKLLVHPFFPGGTLFHFLKGE